MKIRLRLQQSDPSTRAVIRAHEAQTNPENKPSEHNKSESIITTIEYQMTRYVLYIGIRSSRYNYNMSWGSAVSLLRNTLGGWLNFVTLRKRFLKAGFSDTVQWSTRGKESLKFNRS